MQYLVVIRLTLDTALDYIQDDRNDLPGFGSLMDSDVSTVFTTSSLW